MNKNKFLKLILFMVMSFSLVGCSGTIGRTNEIDTEDTKESTVKYQEITLNGKETSTSGYNSTSFRFLNNLISGQFYVVHYGIYYPIAEYQTNYQEETPENSSKPMRQMYFTTEEEQEIPTLYLNEGDTLVYYSTDTLLDTITWERFYDFGYTIGIHNIQCLENERQYLDLDDDDVDCILEDSDLYPIYKLKTDQVLLDKIGGTSITKDLVSTGMLLANTKLSKYDLEIYEGSCYKHYITTANIHAFRSYELFKSIKYKTLQDYFYEVEIPEYFVPGYYNVNNLGLFRLVNKSDYTLTPSAYNERLLYNINESGEIVTDNPDDENYEPCLVYSEFEPLNKFTTTKVDALGFENPDADEDEETVDVNSSDFVLKEATIKKYNIYFPAEKDCSIKITSPTKETTGDARLIIDKKENMLICDRIKGTYTITLHGNGDIGVLEISGLWGSYDIELVNCESVTDKEITTIKTEKEELTDENSTDKSSTDEELSNKEEIDTEMD